MKLSTTAPNTAVHEFAHSIAMESLTKYKVEDHAEFWKEIKAVKRAYIKDVGDDSTRWISAYEHGTRSIDEFLAEAFTQAKMHEMGLAVPDAYGKDLTYSKKVLEIVNKYFGKEKAQANAAEALKNQVKSGIIRYAKGGKIAIPEQKFTGYALKEPDKAKAFKTALGYDQSNAEELIQNIVDHIDKNKFVQKGDAGHGMRYEYIMRIVGANGKEANVLTAWIEEGGGLRMTSVYVTKRKVTE